MGGRGRERSEMLGFRVCLVSLLGTVLPSFVKIRVEWRCLVGQLAVLGLEFSSFFAHYVRRAKNVN